MRPLNRHGVVRYRESLLRIHSELAQNLLHLLYLPLSNVHRPYGIERPVSKLDEEEPPQRLVQVPSDVVRLARFVGVEPCAVEVVALLLDILGYPDVAGKRLVKGGLQLQSHCETSEHSALLRHPD